MTTKLNSRRKPLISIVLPGPRKTLVRVPSIGNVVPVDTGVMLEYPGGDPLAWIETDDEAIIELLTDELNKLVLARDNNEFYEPDFSFF